MASRFFGRKKNNSGKIERTQDGPRANANATNQATRMNTVKTKEPSDLSLQERSECIVQILKNTWYTQLVETLRLSQTHQSLEFCSSYLVYLLLI